jgi:hypothetical protein
MTTHVFWTLESSNIAIRTGDRPCCNRIGQRTAANRAKENYRSNSNMTKYSAYRRQVKYFRPVSLVGVPPDHYERN